MSWRLVVNGPRLTQETSTLYNPRIKYCHTPCRKSANWNGYFNRFACIQLHLYPETTTSPSCLPLLVLVECVGLPSSSLTFISAGSNSLLNFSHLWKKMAFKWSPRLNTRLPFFLYVWVHFHCSVREYYVESKLASVNRQLSKKWLVYIKIPCCWIPFSRIHLKQTVLVKRR